MLKISLALLLVPLLITPAFAEEFEQILPSEQGTLNIGLSVEPASDYISKLNIGWLNPMTNKIQ